MQQVVVAVSLDTKQTWKTQLTKNVMVNTKITYLPESARSERERSLVPIQTQCIAVLLMAYQIRVELLSPRHASAHAGCEWLGQQQKMHTVST